MQKINTQAIKDVLPVLINSLKHHNKELRLLSKARDAATKKTVMKGLQCERLDSKISILKNAVKLSVKLKKEHDLSMFQVEPDYIYMAKNIDARLSAEQLFDNDPNNKGEIIFSDWYSFYHYLYLQENGKDYKKILSLFIRKDTYHQWTHKPFMALGKVMATDLHSLVIIEKEHAPEYTEYPDTSADISKVVPEIRNMDMHFSRLKLLEIINAIPLVPEVIDCEEDCDDGKVWWTYEGKTNDWSEWKTCPKCNGEEEYATENKVPDTKHIIKIGESSFKNKTISILCQVAEILGTDNIQLTLQESDIKANMFQIDDVEILLMPFNIKVAKDSDPDNYTVIEVK